MHARTIAKTVTFRAPQITDLFLGVGGDVVCALGEREIAAAQADVVEVVVLGACRRELVASLHLHWPKTPNNTNSLTAEHTPAVCLKLCMTYGALAGMSATQH